METLTYPATITAYPEHNEWLVEFPDLPCTATSGLDLEDALYMAADCLDTVIHALIDRGRRVPPPRPAREGETPIPLSSETAARLASVMTITNSDNGPSSQRPLSAD